jgi:large subunit ribosomal protein L29
MEAEKIRNLGDEELEAQERQSAERLFRLRFQMKLGQTEGVKKLRDLRKDIARFKTIARERALGIGDGARKPQIEAATEPAATPARPAKKAGKAKPARAAKKVKTAASVKKGAR